MKPEQNGPDDSVQALISFVFVMSLHAIIHLLRVVVMPHIDDRLSLDFHHFGAVLLRLTWISVATVFWILGQMILCLWRQKHNLTSFVYVTVLVLALGNLFYVSLVYNALKMADGFPPVLKSSNAYR